MTVADGGLDLHFGTPLVDEFASDAILVADGKELRFASATVHSTRLQVAWSGTGLSWSAGDTVKLRLDRRVPPAASPEGLVDHLPVWSATLTDPAASGMGCVEADGGAAPMQRAPLGSPLRPGSPADQIGR